MPVNIKKGRSGAIDFTPMIDMVFNLLIFFLVATRFAEEERSMEIALPAASAAVPLTARPKELTINVDKDGRYFVQRMELTAQQLFDVLRQASESNPGRQTVMIRADRSCPVQPVVTALDACKKAGIRDSQLSTATQPGS